MMMVMVLLSGVFNALSIRRLQLRLSAAGTPSADTEVLESWSRSARALVLSESYLALLALGPLFLIFWALCGIDFAAVFVLGALLLLLFSLWLAAAYRPRLARLLSHTAQNIPEDAAALLLDSVLAAALAGEIVVGCGLLGVLSAERLLGLDRLTMLAALGLGMLLVLTAISIFRETLTVERSRAGGSEGALLQSLTDLQRPAFEAVALQSALLSCFFLIAAKFPEVQSASLAALPVYFLLIKALATFGALRMGEVMVGFSPGARFERAQHAAAAGILLVTAAASIFSSALTLTITAALGIGWGLARGWWLTRWSAIAAQPAPDRTAFWGSAALMLTLAVMPAIFAIAGGSTLGFFHFAIFLMGLFGLSAFDIATRSVDQSLSGVSAFATLLEPASALPASALELRSRFAHLGDAVARHWRYVGGWLLLLCGVSAVLAAGAESQLRANLLNPTLLGFLLLGVTVLAALNSTAGLLGARSGQSSMEAQAKLFPIYRPFDPVLRNAAGVMVGGVIALTGVGLAVIRITPVELLGALLIGGGIGLLFSAVNSATQRESNPNYAMPALLYFGLWCLFGGYLL